MRCEFYRQMYLIRSVEQVLLEMYADGKVNGTVHTCIGQEACAVGVIDALNKECDVVFSNHRGHGHFLAYCDDVEGLIAEILGEESGICGGIGGSQHLHVDKFYSSGIQGGLVPAAIGVALAEKMKGTGAISVVFLGDGTMGQGVVYECLNLAGLWKLPVLFVVEDNGYAQSTPRDRAIAGSLSFRFDLFGITGIRETGQDVERVYEAASYLIPEVRGGSPHYLELQTYRFGPHSTGRDDRSPEDAAWYTEHDPLVLLGSCLSVEQCSGIEDVVWSRLATWKV